MIFWKTSSQAAIVTSASPPPSVTLIVPSSPSTFHWPAPSMSNRYEFVIPAVLDWSAREGRFSKKSRTLSDMRGSLPAVIVQCIQIGAVAGGRLPLRRVLDRGALAPLVEGEHELERLA